MQHVLELKQEEEGIYECEICGKRGKVTDFYTPCKPELPDDINLSLNRNSGDPFDFLFKDFNSSLKDIDPIDGI